MKNVISVSNMRDSDLFTINSGVPSLELMYRASEGVYSSCSWNGKIGIVCGKGNNAGDGFALSLILNDHGIKSKLLLVEDNFSKDGLYYFTKAKETKIDYEIINDNTSFDYDIIVDCLLGTGFKGTLTPKYEEVINRINKTNSFVVSVDINSGLNGDNGLYDIAVKSNLTVSIGQIKSGLLLNKAKDLIGELINVDIGIKPIREEGKLIEDCDIKDFYPKRKHFSNKGTYGYVGILGGSKNYPGAVKLAYMGQQALYSGAGVSRVMVPESISSLLFSSAVETTIYPLPINNEGNMKFDQEAILNSIKGLKALACGIGWGVSEDNKKILEYLLSILDIPFVVDADGLNNLSSMNLELLNKTKARVILTPHLKEFSRLINKPIKDIEENLLEYAKEFVSKYNVTLLLKGPTTIICSKDELYFVDKGTPGMAVAGSGDVLTGILIGVLGVRNDNLSLASAVASYLNGLAGEVSASQYGEYGMVSSDTARNVSLVLKDILER